MVNTLYNWRPIGIQFEPWTAGILRSIHDIQLITDEADSKSVAFIISDWMRGPFVPTYYE